MLHGQNDDKTTAYSSLVSDEMAVYEVSMEDVKPKEWQQYLEHKGDRRIQPVTTFFKVETSSFKNKITYL